MTRKNITGMVVGIVAVVVLSMLVSYLYALTIAGKDMSVSPFGSYRTLSANIAIELPESRSGGTHYFYLLAWFGLQSVAILIASFIATRLSDNTILLNAVVVAAGFWILQWTKGITDIFAGALLFLAAGLALTILAAFAGAWLGRYRKGFPQSPC